MEIKNRLLNSFDEDTCDAVDCLKDIQLFIQSNRIKEKTAKRFGVFSELSKITSVFLYDHPDFVEKYGDGFQTESGIFINSSVFLNSMKKDAENRGPEDFTTSLILNSLYNFYLSSTSDKNKIIPKEDLIFFHNETNLNLRKISEKDFKNDLIKYNLLNIVEVYYGKVIDDNEMKEFLNSKLCQVNNVISEYKTNDLRNDNYMLIESAIDNKFLTTNQVQKSEFSNDVNKLIETDFDKENKKALDIFISNVAGIKENNIEDYNKEIEKEISKYAEVVCKASIFSFQKAINNFEYEVKKSILKDNLMFRHNLFKSNDNMICFNHDFVMLIAKTISKDKNYTNEHREVLINSLTHFSEYMMTPKIKMK